MFLLDTDVISERRKLDKANAGVKQFFHQIQRENAMVYLSVITIGEIRTGVESMRHRGDEAQTAQLERWLDLVTREYAGSILPFDEEMAHVWGRLRVPHRENPLDKQIAATALMYDLTVVTRNNPHYESTGAKVLNPFT
jgi:predicted nucleic acid-binding protein